MTIKYVRNWYSLVAIYLNFISSATLKFRNGNEIFLSKPNAQEFREELFRQYLQDKGFSYTIENGRTIIRTNNGLKLISPIPDYSEIIDEVFVRKVYGRSTLYGRTVIDVGASIGDTALFFAQLGSLTSLCLRG